MPAQAPTPVVIGSIPGHVPSNIGGDVIDNNQARYRKWFCTGFEGAKAMKLYMASAAELGLIQPHSFDEETMNLYNAIHAVGISTYFKNWNVVMCPEQAPTTGNWHVHACIIAPSVVSRKAIKKVIGEWDCRPMRGSPSQARNYAIKSGGMAIYIGDAATWDENEQPLARAPPINWAHVVECCNRCRNFRQFKKDYIDNLDPDCMRAAVSKIQLIKELIGANSPPRRTLTHLLTIKQRAIMTLCKDSPVGSHRKIIWIWSSESGTGKSSIADLLRQHDLSVFIYPQEAPLKDALGMYADELVTIIDVPRDGRVDYLYPILESISDQTLLASGKYQGTINRFFCHTIVLSNTSPDHDRLPGRIQEFQFKPLADETYEQIDIASQLSFDFE